MRKQYDDFTQLKLKDMSKSISDMTFLKKEDEKYFNQALLCMDLGLNPKDLRIDEQISIEFANNYIEDKKNFDKKNFHFLSEDIINSYESRWKT